MSARTPLLTTILLGALLSGFVVCLFFTLFTVWKMIRPLPSTHNVPPSENMKQAVSVTLPRLQKSFAVTRGERWQGDWTLSETSLVHLADSVQPGERGNSIMYGHNWPNLLAQLPQLDVGDAILISFADQSQESFVIREKKIVLPDAVDILAETSFPQLTLFTCQGWWNERRLVVIAEPLDLHALGSSDSQQE